MRTPIVRRFWIVLGCCLLPTCILERQATAAPCPSEQTGNATAVRTDDVELDHGFPAGLPDTVEKAREDVFVPASAWEELDDIYGLMALAVVHADWQEPRPKGLVRGHNIGGVLVDETLEVVDWERNSNKAMCNGTQHGEVRTMLKHLNTTGAGDLEKHQIYTSLEPCMMCSGMMMQQKVLRTVYMQTDDGFGKNLERLTIDTGTAPVLLDGKAMKHGYPPAPRAVISSMGRSEFRKELDVAWRAASHAPKSALTGWLQSADAEAIYQRARKKFENYPLRFGTEKAEMRFLAPGTTKPVELKATKTNAELYAAARRLFDDPSSGILPYVAGTAADGTLVESKDNVHATLLLEDPAIMIRAGHAPGDGAPSDVPDAAVLVVDGTVGGRQVHQERVRYDCR